MGHIEIIARGVWIRSGQVLLCRNVKGGFWYLPGGHVDFGESAATALLREFNEEAGLEPAIGRLLLVMENTFHDGKAAHHEILLVFHVEHGPDAAPPLVSSLEPDIAFDWVDLANVVNIDLRPDSMRAWLAAGGMVEEGSSAGWVSAIHDHPHQ